MVQALKNRLNDYKPVIWALAVCALMIFPLSVVFAGEAEEMAEMQKKLNSQVMEKPFSVEDTEKIDADIKDAMAKHMKPDGSLPSSWRPGYTCENLHNLHEYRNCLFYYRYYGHYYP